VIFTWRSISGDTFIDRYRDSRDKTKISHRAHLRINLDSLRSRIGVRLHRTLDLLAVFALLFEVYQKHGLKLAEGFMRVMKFWWGSTGARRSQSTFCGLRGRSAGNSLYAIFEGHVQVPRADTSGDGFINPHSSHSPEFIVSRNGQIQRTLFRKGRYLSSM